MMIDREKTGFRFPLAAMPFFNSMGSGFGKSYHFLYLTVIGMSASRIGMVLSVIALVEIVLPPLMNMLADRYGKHRLLYRSFAGSIVLGNMMIVSVSQQVFVAVGVAIAQIFMRPALTLNYQLMITKLQQRGEDTIGRVRSFGSLGFGLASLLASWVFLWGDYSALFMASALFYGTAAVYAQVLPRETSKKHTADGVAPRTRGFYVFAASQLFVATSHQIVLSFWFIHFQQNLDIPTSELGRIAAASAWLEIPLFMVLDRLMRRFDVRVLYLWGVIGLAGFYILIVFVPSLIWIYASLVVRGVTFALFNLTTYLLMAKISDPVNVATNQILVQGTLPSIAMLGMGPLSGWSYDYFGGYSVFVGCAALCVIAFMIALLGFNTMQAHQPTPDAIPVTSSP